MKRNLLKTARGIVLGLALLISAIPTVVSAQTRTNAPASRRTDAATVQDMTPEKALETRADLEKLLKTLEQTQGVSEQQLDLLRQRLARLDRQIEQMQGQDRQGNTGSAPSAAAVPGVGEEVTITLSGDIDGSGTFIFQGNLVMYMHVAHDYPSDLRINGEPWNNPDDAFALDFVPDFGNAKMVRKEGRNRVNFIPGKDSWSLRIDDTDASWGYYEVTIATTVRSRIPKPAGLQPAQKMSPVAEPDENGELSITIDGNIRGAGHFTFEGNTIRYEPRDEYLKKSTMAVTVNGRPWSLLKKPFSLGFTPDFEKAAIVEKQGRKSVMLIPGKDRIELYVGEFDAMDEKCHVKVALKNQVPRENVRTVWIAADSSEPAEKPDEPQELRLMLSGSFCNRDAFTFEGNTVRYRNEDGEEASDVAIDYLPWRDLSKPFVLDFTPDFDKVSLIPVQEMQERTTITLDAAQNKFDLTLDHAIKDKPYYKFVRLAVKDQVDRRLVRSVRGSAPVQMPIVNGGFGPQPMPNFGFPNMNPDMNGMPKSGRPAFEESNNRTMFPGAAPSRSGAADPAENKEVTLTIEGNFSGYDTLIFKGQSITYQQEKLWHQRESRPLPTDVKVDGVPWDDLSKPFELGYTPDFARAVVLEKVAPYDAGLSRSTTQLQLHFNHPGPPAGYYRFKIAMKDQLRREPEGGFSPFGIMSRTATVDGPTDGMLHPDSAVTRPVYPRDNHDSVRVEVQGTVDRKAGFRLEKGNILVYQNYETDPDRAAPEDPVVLFDGKFASEVTLSDTRDRKAWTNLSVPTMNPSLRSAGPGGGGSAMFNTSKVTHFIFRGDDCDYVYFEHDGVMEIIVTNKTDQPAKFQFVMWNGSDNVFEDNDMQYAPVFGPQTNPPGPSLAPPPPPLSPAPPANAPKIRDIMITVEGRLDAKDAFVFEGNTVRFRPSGDRYPDKLTVNAGMQWPVPDKPFELYLAPDFSKEVTVQSPVGSFTKQPASKNRFEITLGEIVSSDQIPASLWFDLKFTVLRDNIPRSPDAVNPPAPADPPNVQKRQTAAEAQAEIEAAASAAAGLPAGKFPTILNGPMMITSIKEPTDGMDHPDYTVTSPVRAPQFRPEEKIVVKGTVAMEAGFRIQGDRLYYLNFYAIGGAVSGSNLRIYDGRFASGVTVNGKPWTNLTRPFGLDVSLTPTTGKYIGFKAEHCEYDYQFHHDFIEIRITNKKREPAPFELTLWLMDNPAAQEKPEAKEQQNPIANAGPVKIRGGLIPVEDDFTDGRKTTRGDFHYNGLSDVIYVKKEADGIRLEYGLDGVNDLEEQETGGRKLLDPAFRFLGGYDMDKDHRVDTVAWRAIENDSGKHIEVGYGKSGELDDWHVIGMLGVPDGVEWDLYCGNLSGHWDRNSILWHSPTLGAMGYWPDGNGVESWITIPGEYRGPDWKVFGLGDFTGAKKPRDSVLLRHGADDIGYVSPDGKYTKLGRLDDGWEIVAVGDFSNDGCDDLVMFNEELREVGKWDDGKRSKWRSIGYVEAGTAIEGAGDYDGDGWMDLLVRKPDGLMGYFPKADLSRFIPFGYRKDSSWTVIP